MDCPNCYKKAISFTKWIRATNAFTTNCASCNVRLKANYVAYLSFIITLLVALLTLQNFESVLSYFNWHIEASRYKILVFLPVIFVGAIAGWNCGGYKIKYDT